MQNKVINHILHNKIAYAIGGIILAVIGFTLAQTPNFSEQALSGNVGDVISSDASKPSVTFTDSSDLTVAQNEKVTFSVVTQPGSKVSFWLVNLTKPRVRPVNVGSATADATGVAVYSGNLSSKLKMETYRVGVQVSSANGNTLAVSDFAVKVTAPSATALATNNSVTLVTSDGSKVTAKAGDTVTVTLPVTVTKGVTVTMESTTSSFAPVTVAKNVTGSVTWKITNNVTGALRVNVTDTAGVTVPGVTVTVADANTGVTTGMAGNTQTTSTAPAPVTSSMESNVKGEVAFTSPTSSITAVAGKNPVVVSLKASTANELFTLYAVNMATGKQTVFSKGVASGQTVTWLPMEAGNYQLVAVGSSAQVTSSFTVTVVSSTGTDTANTSATTAPVTSSVTAPVTNTVTNSGTVTGTVTAPVTSTGTVTDTVTKTVTTGVTDTSATAPVTSSVTAPVTTTVTGTSTTDISSGVTSGTTTIVKDENGFAVTTTSNSTTAADGGGLDIDACKNDPTKDPTECF